MKEIKRFLSKLTKPYWIGDEYFNLKDKYGDDFEIDGYTHTGDMPRAISLKWKDDFYKRIAIEDFNYVGRLEVLLCVKKILLDFEDEVILKNKSKNT